MRCPHCQHENPDQAEKCQKCGRKLTPDPSLFGQTKIVGEAGRTPDSQDPFGKTTIVPPSGPDKTPDSFPPFPLDPNERLEPGRVLGGRYQIEEELGRGGMGIVFKARDTSLKGREVALKLIHPALTSSEAARERFEDEVIITQALSHPHIVNVLEWHRDGDLRFFTMEYLAGKTLRAWLSETRLTMAQTSRIMDQILDALDHAHLTTVHLDLKPENVMILGDLDSPMVKVMDFGLAKTLSPSHVVSVSRTAGSFGYIAPEQYTPPFRVDHRADLFTAGVLLYEMATGEMPRIGFDLILPSQKDPAIPPQMDDLVMKSLAGNLDNRFATAAEFRTALEALPLSAEIPQPPPLPTGERAPSATGDRADRASKPARKRSGLKWLIAAVLAAAIAVGGYFGVKSILESASTGSQPPDSITAIIDRADRAMEARKYHTARRLFHQVLTRQNDNFLAREGFKKAEKALAELRVKVAPLLSRGREALSAGKLSAAKQSFDRATDLDPENREALTALARIKRRRAEIVKLLGRARAAVSAEKWSEARALLAKVQGLDVDNGAAQRLKGRIDLLVTYLAGGRRHLRARRLARAKAAFNQVQNLMADNPSAAGALKKIAGLENRIDALLIKARSDISRKSFAAAKTSLAQVLKLDVENKAARHLSDRIAKIERQLKDLMTWGQRLERQDKLTEAYGVYKKIQALIPQHAGARSALARLARKVAARKKKARDLLAQAVKLNQAKKWRQALDATNQAIKLDSSLAEAYHQRGLAQVEAGRMDKAVDDLGRAIKLGLGDKIKQAGLFYDRCYALFRAGQNAEAVKDCGRSIKLRPNWTAPYGLRAMILRRLGRTSEARADEKTYKRLRGQ